VRSTAIGILVGEVLAAGEGLIEAVLARGNPTLRASHTGAAKRNDRRVTSHRAKMNIASSCQFLANIHHQRCVIT